MYKKTWLRVVLEVGTLVDRDVIRHTNLVVDAQEIVWAMSFRVRSPCKP